MAIRGKSLHPLRRGRLPGQVCSDGNGRSTSPDARSKSIDESKRDEPKGRKTLETAGRAKVPSRDKRAAEIKGLRGSFSDRKCRALPQHASRAPERRKPSVSIARPAEPPLDPSIELPAQDVASSSAEVPLELPEDPPLCADPTPGDDSKFAAEPLVTGEQGHESDDLDDILDNMPTEPPRLTRQRGFYKIETSRRPFASLFMLEDGRYGFPDPRGL